MSFIRATIKFFKCNSRIVAFILSEQRLQKEHDYKVTRLRLWQKDLEARLTEVLNEVKEFQKKERMSEAQKYVDTLEEIQAKIHGFMEEVSFLITFKS